MSTDILSPANAIICPKGKTDESMVLDMGQIYVAESRIQEVAFVTPHKAPELLALFNAAYLQINKYKTQLEYELVQAKMAAEKIKAVILLDKIPEILEKKGYEANKNGTWGTADIRDAIVISDESYCAACDKVAQIEAITELLKGKIDGMEMAYSSVKKILGESSYSYRPNPNLKAGDDVVGEVVGSSIFGKARY